jgi:endoglucanase
VDQTVRRSRLPLLLAVLVVLVLVVAVVVLVARSQHRGPFALDPQADNVFAEKALYVDPDSAAAAAAAQAEADGDTDSADVFQRIAEVPQGIWLTPEDLPPGEVGPAVAEVVASADKAGDLPVLVIYGIPDRDCTGGFSAGGLTADQYRPWVDEIAGAAGAGDGAVVIVEPDALASAVDCDDLSQRVELIRGAVDSLREAGVTTYVDAGHSDWRRATEVAPLLEEVGVDTVRGFATNVSNFQTDDDERAYADRLVELLGGDVHYVIDRGRNGNGATDDWCNPPGRAFGDRPGFVDDGTRLDAFLWVKPVGESDGECHGGPPAGGFWLSRTLEMADASGW